MFQKLRSPLPFDLNANDVASLCLRIAFGGLMAGVWGMEKFQGFAEKSADWPDPFHIGSANSLGLTIFAELFCAALVTFGLFTRFALIPLIVMLIVIVFSVHGAAPLADKEHALIYLAAYLAIFWLGSGKFSLDALLWSRGNRG